MTAKILILMLFVCYYADAQVVRNQYYFLQRPTSGVFSMAFGEPNGKSDPIPAPGNTDMAENDLIINNSTLSESFFTTKDNSSDYLFGSWSRIRGVNVSGKFAKVKHVTLKNDSWKKINDNLFHVVEALRADTVELKIKSNKDDKIGSTAIQKIAGLFVDNYTAVGKILIGLGNNSSAMGSEAEKSIVKLKYATRDSLSMYIIDNTVYYAVRFAKVDPSKDNIVKIIGIPTNRLRAPECAVEMKKNPPVTVQKNMTGKTIQLLMAECKVNDAFFSAMFIYDPSKNISNVTIVRKRPNQVLLRTKTDTSPNQILDTIYISEYIDFSNEYKNERFAGSFQFVANENPNPNNIQNVVAVCDFNIAFNPATRLLDIVNYDNKQYRTCFYYETAKIRYFPN